MVLELSVIFGFLAKKNKNKNNKNKNTKRRTIYNLEESKSQRETTPTSQENES